MTEMFFLDDSEENSFKCYHLTIRTDKCIPCIRLVTELKQGFAFIETLEELCEFISNVTRLITPQASISKSRRDYTQTRFGLKYEESSRSSWISTSDSETELPLSIPERNTTTTTPKPSPSFSDPTAIHCKYVIQACSKVEMKRLQHLIESSHYVTRKTQSEQEESIQPQNIHVIHIDENRQFAYMAMVSDFICTKEDRTNPFDMLFWIQDHANEVYFWDRRNPYSTNFNTSIRCMDVVLQLAGYREYASGIEIIDAIDEKREEMRTNGSCLWKLQQQSFETASVIKTIDRFSSRFVMDIQFILSDDMFRYFSCLDNAHSKGRRISYERPGDILKTIRYAFTHLTLSETHFHQFIFLYYVLACDIDTCVAARIHLERKQKRMQWQLGYFIDELLIESDPYHSLYCIVNESSSESEDEQEKECQMDQQEEQEEQEEENENDEQEQDREDEQNNDEQYYATVVSQESNPVLTSTHFKWICVVFPWLVRIFYTFVLMLWSVFLIHPRVQETPKPGYPMHYSYSFPCTPTNSFTYTFPFSSMQLPVKSTSTCMINS